MMDQHPSQYTTGLAADADADAAIAAEQDAGDIFLDMLEKSSAFFDNISMSDSVTPNPFISTSSTKANTMSESANSTTYDLQEARDASSTIASSQMLGGIMLDNDERQGHSPVIRVKSIIDSSLSVESINMLGSHHEQLVLGSDERELDISLGSAQHEHVKIGASLLDGIPIQDEVFEEERNASLTVAIKTNVTVGISHLSLFDTDTDSEDIEEKETGELNRMIDDISTMTEGTYPPMLSNFTPYSSKPFAVAEMQAYGMQKQDELLPANRRRSSSAEVVYMQRLEEIAAQRSIIAQIAIKFEDLVMSICGQKEEVLYLVVEKGDEDEESVGDNKSGASKQMMICVPEANDDNMNETPIHEKAKKEYSSMGMAGLLNTIEISRVCKLTTKDRALVPLYERAVLDLVSLENQAMRKARAIEVGKRTLAFCSRSIDKLDAATNVSFLEVEMKETQRKVVKSRESLQRLYEAFSPKTQKAIHDLQMDGFR
jgi:hypothetical protein